MGYIIKMISIIRASATCIGVESNVLRVFGLLNRRGSSESDFFAQFYGEIIV